MPKLKIYIVDDNSLMNTLARRAVKAWFEAINIEEKAEVFPFVDSEEAILAFKKLAEADKSADNYYLVIMDYNMPKVTGLEAAKSIKEIIKEDTNFKAILKMVGFSTIYDEILDENITHSKYQTLRPTVLQVFDGYLSKEPIKDHQWQETLTKMLIEMGWEILSKKGLTHK